MHEKAVLPTGCVITLISNMCQESDSSRQARGELGLCSRGTEAEEATDSHSSISALIREMMGKHVDAGEEKTIKFGKCLENVHLLWGSQGTICVFKRCCVGCELWAYSDLIQLSPPFLPSVQSFVPPQLSWIPSLAVSLRQQAAKTQTTVSVQSPPDRSLAADQKYFQTKTYIE